ncbi:MAG TPA: pitrilysin family protein [Blastocatellia bacterium]|nr:pitrilysin family protein [Blastocatellia bacterium]
MRVSNTRQALISFAMILAVAAPGVGLARAGKASSSMASVLLPNSSPLVSFRLLFNVGSASDPKGKEGVAALTASMISDGGSRAMSYEQIVQAMYPMATGFASQVDKEMTVFSGTTHIDNLPKYYQIVSGMLLDPGFRDDDFKRLRTDAINFLKESLRGNNDEELGKEALYLAIYDGRAYGHQNIGTVESLEKLTVEDVKKFYHDNYTQANFVLGLAGAYAKGFDEKVQADVAAKLPAGTAAKPVLAEPEKISGLEMQVIKKDTPATAISFGFPIAVTRSDPDWPALLLVQSYFGQHRNSNSYLYQRLRQIRGLNYGDYAYIEYFPRGMFQFAPDPNLGRRQQIFQVWIRPVEPKNGLFALRAGLYELNKLVQKGMSQEDFEATRRFLTKNVNTLTKTQDAQLGYAIDSKYYGIATFTDYVRDQLSKLTLEDVNRVIRKYLQAENVQIVVVTKDAEAFKQTAVDNKPSPISYTSLPPKEILEEDKMIESYKLNFNPKKVEVVPVDQVFQK